VARRFGASNRFDTPGFAQANAAGDEPRPQKIVDGADDGRSHARQLAAVLSRPFDDRGSVESHTVRERVERQRRVEGGILTVQALLQPFQQCPKLIDGDAGDEEQWNDKSQNHKRAMKALSARRPVFRTKRS